MSSKKIQAHINIDLSALLLTGIFLIISYQLIHYFYHPIIPPIEQLKALIFLPEISLAIQPKPVENLTWMVFLLLIPIYNFISLKLLTSSRFIFQYSNLLAKILIPIISIAILFGYISSDFKKLTSPVLSLYPHDIFHYLKLLFFLVLIFLTCTVIARRSRSNCENKLGDQKLPMALITLLAILIPTLSFRLESLSNATDTSFSWFTGFDAVFYPLSQVVNGKTLLVNLPSQYGLYPELLNPLFKFFSLNVFHFSLIMEILQVSALLALAILIIRSMKNQLFALTSILSLCWVTGGTWLSHLNVFEPYQQYAPIRFFFPALGILLFYKLLRNDHLKNIIGFSIFGAIAAIWNMDSGIPVIGAFWAYGFMRILFPGKIKRHTKIFQFMISILTVMLSWAGFLIYLYFKSGHSTIYWHELFQYQKTFAITGFGMIPIPKSFHLWMVFYGIYILGVIIAFHRWMKNKSSNSADLIFYMSILGFGLFTYYQGRSHEYNLVAVSWLPLLIGFILSERMLRLVRAKQIDSKFAYLGFVFIFISVVLTLSYIMTLPKLADYGKNHVSAMMHQQIDPVISENIAFIKSHTPHSQQAVILARNQGIYYAMTHLSSPINAPGYTQMILQSDADNFIHQLQNHPVRQLFIQSDADNHIPILYQPVLKNYNLREKSSRPSRMFYLEGKFLS